MAANNVSTTFGRLYNATGSTITYVTAYDWKGNVAGKYPLTILNGQWAVFQHVGTRAPGPNRQASVAALVYRIEDRGDALIAWNNPWDIAKGEKNTVYCKMDDIGYFNKCDWDEIHAKLMESGTTSQTTLDDHATKVFIDSKGNTPTFTATFYLNL